MKKYTLILIFFFFPVFVFANSASIEVDTGVDIINAIEGELILPADFKILSIYDGDSAIVFWISRPKLEEGGRMISFSGIIPGGFRGKSKVFTISGNFVSEQLKAVTFKSVRAFRNDSEASLALVKLTLLQSDSLSDTDPPERFNIVLGRAEELFDGRPFLSFEANDKKSGILRYEATEKIFGYPDTKDWYEVMNPYEIKDKVLYKKVYIKAIDKIGNERVESTSLPRRNFLMFFLAIIIGALWVLIAKGSQKRPS